jgi:hypothetical protein
MVAKAAIPARKTGVPANGRVGRSRQANGRPSAKMQEALAIAAEKGLLEGGRTVMLRGRMPAALVKTAKQKTGIASDSKLIEAALANIAIEDDYLKWLFSQRGTVSPDLDLEF